MKQKLTSLFYPVFPDVAEKKKIIFDIIDKILFIFLILKISCKAF